MATFQKKKQPWFHFACRPEVPELTLSQNSFRQDQSHLLLRSGAGIKPVSSDPSWSGPRTPAKETMFQLQGKGVGQGELLTTLGRAPYRFTDPGWGWPG